MNVLEYIFVRGVILFLSVKFGFWGIGKFYCMCLKYSYVGSVGIDV